MVAIYCNLCYILLLLLYIQETGDGRSVIKKERRARNSLLVSKRRLLDRRGYMVIARLLYTTMVGDVATFFQPRTHTQTLPSKGSNQIFRHILARGSKHSCPPLRSWAGRRLLFMDLMVFLPLFPIFFVLAGLYISFFLR